MTVTRNMDFSLRVYGADKAEIERNQCHLFDGAGVAFRRTVELPG